MGIRASLSLPVLAFHSAPTTVGVRWSACAPITARIGQLEVVMSKEQFQLVLVGICVVAGIAVVVSHPWVGLIAGGILGWSGIKKVGKIAGDYTKAKASATMVYVKDTVSKNKPSTESPTVEQSQS